MMNYYSGCLLIPTNLWLVTFAQTVYSAPIESVVNKFGSLLSDVFFGSEKVSPHALSSQNALSQLVTMSLLHPNKPISWTKYHNISTNVVNSHNVFSAMTTFPPVDNLRQLNSMNASNGTDGALVSTVYSPTHQNLIIAAGTLLSIVTVGGNLLVMLSFRVDHRLQVISNYFLFSLSVADLTIGLVSCPLMTFYTAKGEWTLGYTVCQFWLNVDYLMSNASVWNLLLISLDRYFSVTRPLTYRPRRTTKKALIMIASTYILSLALWPPWIIAWPYIEGRWVVQPNECVVQFLKTNALVTIGTILAAFYLPVTIMIILYTNVYFAAQRRQREFKSLQGISFRRHVKTQSRNVTRPERESFCSIEETDISAVNAGNFQKLSTVETPVDAHPKVIIPPNANGNTVAGKIKRHWNFFSWRRISNQQNSTAHPKVYRECSSEATTFNDCSVMNMTAKESFGGVTFKRSTGSFSRKPTRERKIEPLIEEDVLPVVHKRRPSFAKHSLSIGSDERRYSHTYLSPVPTSINDYTVVIKLPPEQFTSVRKARSEIKVYESQSESETQSNTETLQGDRLDQDFQGHWPPERKSFTAEPTLEGGVKNLIRLAGLTSGAALIGNANPNEVGVIAPRPGIHSLFSKEGVSFKERLGRPRRRRSDKRQESKAAKTLSAILLAFILTWAPYSIIVCIEAFRKNTVPADWFTFSYYLCYINSTVNPVLYAFCNPNFKRTYIRILTCKWKMPKREASCRNLSAFRK